MKKIERGKLIVISGPSGAGKSTVIGKVMSSRKDSCFSVSVTTRPPRPGETEGIDYFFVSRDQFDRMAADGQLLEYASYVGNSYGTPRQYVEERRNLGLNVILDIEVQGAAQVKSLDSSAISVFVVPPDVMELERRLRGRKTDCEEKIQQRLRQARVECMEAAKYDYIVINDDPDGAAKEIDAIITAEYCRAADRLEYLTEVLLK